MQQEFGLGKRGSVPTAMCDAFKNIVANNR